MGIPVSFRDIPSWEKAANIEDGRYRAHLSSWEKAVNGGILVKFTLEGSKERDLDVRYLGGFGPKGPDYTGVEIKQFFAPTGKAIRYLRVMLSHMHNTSAWVSEHFDMPVEQILEECLEDVLSILLGDGKVKDWGSWNYFEYLD